jgi:hypothetical protein
MVAREWLQRQHPQMLLRQTFSAQLSGLLLLLEQPPPPVIIFAATY